MKKQQSNKLRWLLPLCLILVVLGVVAGVVLMLLPGQAPVPATEATTSEPVQTEQTKPTTQVPESEFKLYWNVDRTVYYGNKLTMRPQNEDGHIAITFAVDGEQVRLFAADRTVANKADSLEVMGLVFDNEGLIVDVLGVDECAGGYAVNHYYVEDIQGDEIICNNSPSFGGYNVRFKLEEDTKIYRGGSVDLLVGVPTTVDYSDEVVAIKDKEGKIIYVYVIPYVEPGDVYWNVTRMYNSVTGMTTRETDMLGYYVYEVALNGELTTVRTRDMAVASAMDKEAGRHWGLEFDENGDVSGVISAKKVTGGSFFTSWYHVTEVTEDGYHARKISSGADNGDEKDGTFSRNCKIFDVSGVSGHIGIQVDKLQVGDQITALTDSREQVCLIFIINRMVDSELYWNVERKYDSTNKVSTREPDIFGWYSFKLAVNGKQVTLRTQDKEIVNLMDAKADRYFGLAVDGDVITQYYHPDKVTGGTFFASWCVVTDITEEGDVTALRKDAGSNQGTSYTARMAEGCKVYNVSNGYTGFMGEETTLRVGDKIQGQRNYKGELVTIFVVGNRTIESELYWNVERKYDSTNKVSTREPNAEGWYEFVLAVNGKQVTLKTKDKEIVNSMDAKADRYFGLLLNGDVIIRYVHPDAVTGGSFFASWCVVTDITAGGEVTALRVDSGSNQGTSYTARMAPGCKVYNVSNGYTKLMGEETTLQVGDKIQGQKNADGELVTIFVVGNRTVESELYWNVNRKWDAENSVSTREPNEEGWYEFVLAVNGKQVTLKTKDQEIVRSMDAKADRYFGLLLEEDVIVRYLHPDAVTGGTFFASWCDVTEITKDGEVTALRVSAGSNQGTSYTAKMAEGCKVYNVSTAYTRFVGEETTLQLGDRIQGQKNKDGELVTIYVVGNRTVESELYWNVNRKWDSTNKVSTREPNAEGWYEFVLAVNGKQVTLKTKDADIVYSMDAKADRYFGLLLEGDVIVRYLHPDAVTGGSFFASWCDVTEITADGQVTALRVDSGSNQGTSYTAQMAEGCKVYNVSSGFVSFCGEETTLKVGDQIQGQKNKDGQLVVIYVVGKRTPELEHSCQHVTEDQTWYAWNGSSSITKPGHYVLSQDITLTGSRNINANGDVTLCLNGYTVTCNTEKTGLYINNGSHLTICDHKTPDGKWAGTFTTDYTGISGGVFYIFDGGEVSIYGGNFVHTGTANAGGIGGVGNHGGGAQLTVYDGNFTGGTVKKNGGILIAYDAGRITIHGGTFTGGAAANGGQICVGNGELTVTGGTFTGGTAENGGLVYLGTKSKATITGGTFTGGKATSRGGNLCAAANVTLSLSDCVFENGVSDNEGGNMGFGSGDVTIGTGTVIRGGSAVSGGNIINYGKLTITDGLIENGTSTSRGGNLYLYTATASDISITGGTIQNGTSKCGGNIWLGSNTNVKEPASIAKLTITGGTIQGGVANGDRGGNLAVTNSAQCTIGGDAKFLGGTGKDGASIALSRYDKDTHSVASLTITGGTFTGGTFTDTEKLGNGAILWIYKGQCRISGGSFSGGEAANGGLLYTLTDTKLDITGGTFTGGSAQNGGLVNIASGTEAVISGGTFTGGKATARGGNICAGAGAKLALSNCVIENGVSDSEGGNLGFGSCDVTIGSGTVIRGGTAVNGGNIINYGKLTVTDGLIEGGTASSRGGNLYLYAAAASDISITGGTIQNGTGRSGGNIWLGSNSNKDKAPASAAKLSITGGTIQGGVADGDRGGNLFILNEAQCTIGGDARILGGTGKDGPTIALSRNDDDHYSTADLTITGGTFTGGTFTDTEKLGNGGVLWIYRGQCRISGGNFSGGKAVDGGLVYLSGNGQLDISGGTFTGGEATNEGGNLYLGSGCNVTISGGLIEKGTAKNGGNIVSFAQVGFTGGTIKDGTAAGNGGNIQTFRGNSGTLTMSGTASIEGGSAVKGGSVYCAGVSTDERMGTFVLQGGTVSGDVYVANKGKLSVSGGSITGKTTLVSGSTAILEKDAVLSDLYLAKGASLGLGAGLSGNGSITISMEEPGKFAERTLDTDAQRFAPKDNALDVFDVSGQLYLAKAGSHLHCLCNGAHEGVGDHTQCTVVEWQPWTQDMAAPTDGYYYLADDVNLTDKVRLPKDSTLSLCLNSHALLGAEGKAMYEVCTGLNITDCAPKESWGSITSQGNIYGSVFYMFNNYGGSEVNLFGGILENALDTMTVNGAIVYMGNRDGERAIFNMYDGIIAGANSSASGAAMYVSWESNFNMYGGTINGGKSTATNSDPNKVGGGSIFASGADVVINVVDGTITGGSAATNGGNIVLTGGALMHMTGGTVSGGTAANGGNINVHNGTLNISGDALISGGIATTEGGNLRLGGSGTVNMTGGSVEDGGFKTEGDVITVLTGNGGNIYSFGKVNISGGTVSGGRAKDRGGNIATYSGTVTLSGEGTVQNGVAGKKGGNIGISAAASGTSTLNMTGGTVSGGIAGNNGHNLWSNKTMSLTGGKVLGTEGQTCESVFAAEGSQLTVGGNVQISGAAKNLYLAENQTVALSGVSPDARICVTAAYKTAFATAAVATDARGFRSDDPAYMVILSGDSLMLTDAVNEFTLRYDDRVALEALVGFSGEVEITDQVVTSKAVGTETKDANVLVCENGTLYAVGTGTAKLVVNGTSYDITVEPAPISLFMITGHSIGRGEQGNGEQSVAVEAGQAYSTHRYEVYNATGSAAIIDPSSVTANTGLGYGSAQRLPCIDSFAPGQGGNEGEGSALAWQWNRLTGEKAWVINAAVGGSCLNEWLPGVEGHATVNKYHFDTSVAAFQNAQAILKNEIAAGHYTLSHTAIFYHSAANFSHYSDWTQESLEQAYETMWNGFKTQLTTDMDGDGVDETVEALGLVPIWTVGGSNNYQYDKAANFLMAASDEYPDVFMGSVITRKWMTADGLETFPAIKYGTQSQAVAVPESVYHTNKGGTSDNSVFCANDTTHLSQVTYNAQGIDLADNLYAYFNRDNTVGTVKLHDLLAQEVPDSLTMHVGDKYALIPQLDKTWANDLTFAATGAIQTEYPLTLIATNEGTGTLTVSQGTTVLKTLNVTVKAAHGHCVCNGTAAQKGDHVCDSDVTWTAWGDDLEEMNTLPTQAGYYYLTRDVDLSDMTGTIKIQNVQQRLCLNGHKITGPAANVSIWWVYDYMAITDCTTEGSITVNNTLSGGMLHVFTSTGGTFELFGGKLIQTGTTTSDGGLIYLGNKAGSVATFNMYGGILTGGKAGNFGGAIIMHITEPTVFNMYGGLITECSAKYGGAICVGKGEAHIYGGNIERCSATDQGGGIYVRKDAGELFIHGGEITGCDAVNGGNLAICEALTMSGGTVSGGTATTTGGNIYLIEGGTIEMTGGTISGGSSKDGGSINVHVGTMTVSDSAKIEKGYASNEGGNFRIGGSGTVYLNGGTVENGGVNDKGETVTKKGGNFQVYGKLYIAGGTVTGGKVSNQGGNISAWGGKIQISSGSVTNGTADGSGGNIVVHSASTAAQANYAKLTMTGGTVSGGTAPTAPDVYLETRGTADLSGTAVARVNVRTANTVTMGTFSTGASIYLEAANTIAVASGLSADPTAYLTCAAGWQLSYTGGTLTLQKQ